MLSGFTNILDAKPTFYSRLQMHAYGAGSSTGSDERYRVGPYMLHPRNPSVHQGSEQLWPDPFLVLLHLHSERMLSNELVCRLIYGENETIYTRGR